MKAFKFTLQPLRVLRERQEQTALHAYAVTVQAVTQAGATQLAARQVLEEGWTERRKLEGSGVSAFELVQSQEYCTAMEQRMNVCTQRLRAAEQASQQAFTRLMAARKATAMVDRFLEKQKQEHRLRRRKHEQKELDELSRRRQGISLSGPLEESR